MFSSSKSTSELIQENLFKYSFLAKQQIVRSHVVPTKLRSNNLKLVVTQLGKERINIKTNLKVALQKFKLKQDKKNKKDIFKLQNIKIQSLSKLEKLRTYLVDLNTELSRLEKKYRKETQEQKKFILKSIKKNEIPDDVEKILFKKTIWYNNGVKKQKELKNTLDGILKEKLLKKEACDMVLNQLNRIERVLAEIGGNALKWHKERQQALQYLKMLRDSNETEKRERREKIYAAMYKFKMSSDMIQFIRKKRRQRHVQNKVKNYNENIENNKTNDELIKFMKYLIHVSGDTDLDKITENIEEINNQKESLFCLLIFFEQQFTKLENSIDCAQKIEVSRKIANNNRHELNRCQLKMYLDDIKKNTEVIKSSQEHIEYLKNSYQEFCKMIDNTCQILNIRPLTKDLAEKNVLPNEDNISDYVKEMEKKSYEILFKVNCVENSCLKEQNEDILSSDGESMQNLISKDYDGIEIKMHRVLQI